MGCVGFNYYRISRGQGRSCVSARNRECQRKIAGAKHNYGAHGTQRGTKVGLGSRFATRVRAVDSCRGPGTFFHYLGKQSKLPASSSDLALQPGFRKSGFLFGPFDDFGSVPFNIYCDRPQECGFVVAGGASVNFEGFVSQGGGGIDFLKRRGIKLLDKALSSFWICGVENLAAGGFFAKTDDRPPCQFHHAPQSSISKPKLSS